MLPVPALVFLAVFLKRTEEDKKQPVDIENRMARLSDRFHVTPRESEIIGHICLGLSNKEIAKALFISVNTVKRHTNQIYQKLGVKSRVQLVNFVRDSLGDNSGREGGTNPG